AGNGQHAAVDIRAAAQQPEEPRQTSMSGPLNLRSDRRPPPAQRAFSRQVSLGSGVAVMGMDRGGRNGGRPGQRALPRSGKSLGVLNHSGGLGPDGAARRGGDFSMFRTKSTLSKQNSMLPSRIKEELDGVDLDHAEGQPAGRPADVDPLNKSVPAGRYFAALRGPELDEVRVRLRGHPAAQGRGVAVPAAVPDRLLRGLPGARQPGHPVGRAGGEPGDGVPPGDADDQRRRVAAGDGGAGGHVRHLRAQVRLLLRGHPARVLPPGARQLLLHAVHRRHVPRHRPPPRLRAGEAAPGRVVRVRGAAVRAGAQDLRAVAVGRQAEAVQGSGGRRPASSCGPSASPTTSSSSSRSTSGCPPTRRCPWSCTLSTPCSSPRRPPPASPGRPSTAASTPSRAPSSSWRSSSTCPSSCASTSSVASGSPSRGGRTRSP
uniref:Uncharacterized protein n=1 Tax=Aegilops tauschii subsp. strangulata TaxID=200361 RepID=A0A453CL68_AEGTS